MTLTDFAALEAAATPGPWHTWGWFSDSPKSHICTQPEWFDELKVQSELSDAEQILYGDEGAECNPEDAALIVALRNSWPAISKALRAGEAWLKAEEAVEAGKDIAEMPGYKRDAFRAALKELEKG